MTLCHTCGHRTMIDRHGTFRFEPPPTIPGGPIFIPNSTWRECATCGEQVITRQLDQAIDQIIARRRQQHAQTRRLKYLATFLLGMIAILAIHALYVIFA